MRTTPATTDRRARSRWARLRRAAIIGTLLLLTLLVGGQWLVTRGWFLEWQLSSVLSDRMGGDVELGPVVYRSGGRLTIDGLTLRARGLEGPAAEVLRVREVEAYVDLDALRQFVFQADVVTLRDVTLRISEDLEDPGVYNFMALRPSLDPNQRVTPPGIRIGRASLEVGHHVGADYRPMAARRLAGSLHPSSRGGGWFDFFLREHLGAGAEHTGDTPFVLAGQWNAQTLEHLGRISGTLRLDRETYGLFPRSVRLLWESMQLEGQVSSVSVQWNPGELVTASLDVEDLALTLPFDPEGWWSRYEGQAMTEAAGQPHMHVSSGRIRIDGNRLLLEDLSGTLGSTDGAAGGRVPYDVDLTIGPFPDLDWTEREAWLDRVRTEVPFEMDLQIEGFSLSDASGETPPLELPTPVVDVLVRFGVTGGSLDSDITIRRLAGIPMPRSEGRLSIHHASVLYGRFPYALRDIEAAITFDHESITVASLAGRGEGESMVRASGSITPPTPIGAIDFGVQVTDLALDATFREALNERQGRVYDALFNRAAFERYRAAGLLPDDAGTFEPGAVVDADLRVRRPEGPEHRTEVSGEVTVRRGTVYYESFPYPLRVTGGTLSWTPREIVLLGEDGNAETGLPFRTLDGGAGRARGSIHMPRIGGAVRTDPDLHFDVRGDTLGPALALAIPAPRPDTSARRWLEALGASAELACSGVVRRNDDGQVDFAFDAVVANGRIEPAADLVTMLAARGPLWPEAFAVSDVHGRIEVRPRTVVISELTGSHAGGPMRASGLIDASTTPIAVHLQLGVDGLPVAPYVMNAAASSARDALEARWRDLRPRGVIDVTVWSSPDPAGTPVVEVRPRTLTLHHDETSYVLDVTSGLLAADGGAMTLHEIEATVTTDGRADGRLHADGTVHLGDENEIDLVVGLEEGRFESPLLASAAAMAGEPDLEQVITASAARGTFDAEVSITGGRNAPRRIDTTLQPRSLHLERRQIPIDVRFDPDAMVTLRQGLAELEGLRGEIDGAGRFVLGGLVRPGRLANLAFSFDGSLTSDPVQALLPEVVADQLGQLELSDGPTSTLRNGRLRLAKMDGAGWAVDFGGRLETEGAALEAGVALEDLAGIFDLSIEARPDEPLRLDLEARDGSLTVLGYRLEDAEATLRLDEDGRRLIVPAARGRGYGGSVLVSGRYDLGAGAEYATVIEIAGVSLGELVADLRRRTENTTSTFEPSGRVYATIGLGGRAGDPAGRFGRGAIRVHEGRVERMPSSLRWLQFIELAAPSGSTLENVAADLDFFINGERLVFEDIMIDSASFDLSGSGEMASDTLEMDLHLTSRSKVPVVREVISALREQLVAIEVRGPLGDPQPRFVPAGGLRAAPGARPVLRNGAQGPRVDAGGDE